MKNPYIASLFPEISNFRERTSEELMALSGRNLGNFMFCSSVRRVVPTITKTRSIGINQKKLAAECDGIVIPAANWLQPKNDFTGLAKAIETANVPCVVIGIGAQTFEGKIPELTEGTIRLLKVVSERSHSISVRGPFSGDVLSHYGIKNVAVTGCPSLLWHLDHSAEITRFPKNGKVGRVTINGTVPGLKRPKVDNARMRLGCFITQQAARLKADYVVQTEMPFLRGHLGELPDDETDTWNFLEHVFDETDRSVIQAYLDNHIRAFPSVPEWQAYCANHDLVLGSRLHGVIAGLLSGAPSVLITHDTRTEEMGKFSGIPTIRADDLMEKGRIDPDAILADADFDTFNTRQQSYFDNFVGFFEDNNVPHRLNRRKD